MPASDALAGWFLFGAALVVMGGFALYALAIGARAGGTGGAPIAALLVAIGGYLLFLGRLDPYAPGARPAPERWLLFLCLGLVGLLVACVRWAELRIARRPPATPEPEAPATPVLAPGPRSAQSGSSMEQAH